MVTWDDVRDLEKDLRALEPEEESEAQARERMLPAEQQADDTYREQQGREARLEKRRGRG
jgi:hypothetical protein